MLHSEFDYWTDYTGQVLITCLTCSERYYGKTSYHAKQWLNKHTSTSRGN